MEVARLRSEVLQPGFLNPDVTQRRNKKRRYCFQQELVRSHRKHSGSNKPAASTETSTSSPSCSPQAGSQREGSSHGDNAINFHSAFAKYRKGHFKDF